MSDLELNLPLGKVSCYADVYDPGLLCPVPRSLKREELGLAEPLPFAGEDLWNAYELSWLNARGKPVVALGEFRFPCDSANLVESKSLKLYLNSFNQTRFDDFGQVRKTITADLSAAAGGTVQVSLEPVAGPGLLSVSTLPGRCIDDLDIAIDDYGLAPELLRGAADDERIVTETLHSHLLKSNCLVTGQPDWGSVLIRYRGPRIDPAALLRYLVSFRRHNEFHEQCVERIFVDLQRFCRPRQLTVYARYTRRGGLDINPFRSNFEVSAENLRLVRQ
ncbi:NADPH-dependent 7-cyano-7-deazaguanine reductase QueF [Geothermobacter hydrogeniphilus]|uniref:NADPH-dependent 7-cyano-7-deazaguanine reductase QueF n=1 Tax=Geothermobacter hydrogeniphilus TaxID=1969733 RepID=A0A1X0YBD2_9BACT|nr:NADPH-dependent 7-cyano-7-deazaguanine reductase QueF [Geothermobacter hydrogeniphilus]ORJ62511.1 NADPH-dependent 7-cyano-7-deazaguanine reductase QueF [Geothermobacter hydrogeniphilus]